MKENGRHFSPNREKNWMETFVDKTCGALDKSAKMRIYFGPKKKEEYFFLIVIHCDKAGFFCLD